MIEPVRSVKTAGDSGNIDLHRHRLHCNPAAALPAGPSMEKKTTMQNRSYPAVIEYHNRSKHHYHRYARSAGRMDWENQPVPFRFYDDSVWVPLPFLQTDPPVPHAQLYCRSDRSAAPFTMENIAGLLELSLGLSAWKSLGNSRWSLRMNPSSGNLHPTEAYLVLPETPPLQPGLYHYNSLQHALERRAVCPTQLSEKLASHFGTRGFLVGLSSIFWRESWKYGERAFRYCNHDVGHAVAGLSLAAGLWGWRFTYLNALSDRDVELILGFDRTAWSRLEAEHPDLIGFIGTQEATNIPRGLPKNVLQAFGRLKIQGRPNRLSREAVDWKIIYDTAETARKPPTEPQRFGYARRPFIEQPTAGLSAPAIIRSRRSAIAFDPEAVMDDGRFQAVLDKTLPRDGCPPFDVQVGETFLHLLIFVHGVQGLEQGLYFLLRRPDKMQVVRKAFRPDFAWQPVKGDLPLYLLQTGDFRHKAAQMSCHQEIAGDSTFSLGMIAEFDAAVRPAAYRYRQLYWEAGMIGQTLYLEAEAQGFRGTGIGCYFDDPVHEVIGIADHSWQSLYHFTVGRAIEDPRLTTLPAYHHLEKLRQPGKQER
jgi:SagB-type dehydrogenase family enzyme